MEGAKTTQPFPNCSMDLITDLPPIDDCNSILVVVDRGLMKGVILIPTTKTLTADGTGQLLLDNLYKRFGLPDEILSDRGPQFAAQAFQELLKLLGIKSKLTTAYHPQTDGATERVNQEIEAYLSIYCSSHPTEWKNSISTLEFTHNNRRHADRLKTPFELMLGKNPIAIPTSFENTRYPTVEKRIKNLVTSQEEALAAHKLARNHMAERINSMFTPFKENDVHGENYIQPPPDIEEGEEVYEVEAILKHRKRGRGYEYLIKWVGYPITEASWEPTTSFTGAIDTLQEYKERHQL